MDGHHIIWQRARPPCPPSFRPLDPRLRQPRIHEKAMTVAEICDGSNVKCTFRRRVGNGDRIERAWLEVVQLASTISPSDEDDEMIWQFTATVYTSQSLYKIINSRGILPTHCLREGKTDKKLKSQNLTPWPRRWPFYRPS